jgi:L-aspartate oxidase
VFIDVTHLPPRLVTTRFPNIYRFCLSHGLDITKELIPVAPAAHYMIGGVKTNSWGETSIKGLFACGETACTGVHGANRLASNSLLDAVVFSKRIITATTEDIRVDASTVAESNIYTQLNKNPDVPPTMTPGFSALQTLHWNKVSIIRNREGLSQAANELAAWQKMLPQPADRPSYELSNLIMTGRLVTEAAIKREESRGAHFRTDYPESLPQWQRHIIFTRD